MFDDLLDETKGFKYQITLTAMSKKCKPNGEIEFCTIYFNSTTKTVINHKFDLKKYFKKFWAGLITRLIKTLVGLLN